MDFPPVSELRVATVRQMAEIHACERFVDELLKLVPEPGFRRRFSAGFTLVKLVRLNMESGINARGLDVTGFRKELVENNQGGEALRHLRFHSGLVLIGPLGWLASWAFHLLDWLQARKGRPESATEMADNRAGQEVGKLMIQGFRGNIDSPALKAAILEVLAEEIRD